MWKGVGNVGVWSRAASLAAVPVKSGAKFAGAAAKTALGADKDVVYTKATEASVEALTAALSKARGPALKFGQVLALFSQMLPPEQAAALQSLGNLYENATPRPWEKVRHIAEVLPAGVQVERDAIAAASLGQVHRGTWIDGRPIAVKLQYADAHRIVRADMLQLRTFIPLIHRIMPELDVRALLDEHEDRLWEELDYTREARTQAEFRAAWAEKHPGVVTIPDVLFSTPEVLVTEWLEGIPFTRLVQEGSQEERDVTGRQLARFTLWSADLLGKVHADPHPGNYRLMPDGTLGVLDFGSVGSNVGAFTHLFASTFKLASRGENEAIRDLWIATGLIPATTSLEDLLAIIDLDLRVYEQDEFTFARDWMGQRSEGWTDPNTAVSTAKKLQMPPHILLEHRAVGGMLALLSSLEATVDMRTVLDGIH